MENKKNIYVFCNQKGGVGKTTTVFNIGTCLSQLGFKILIVDTDPQGNATSGFGIDKTTVKSTIYDIMTENKEVNDTIIRDVLPCLDLIPSNAHLAGIEIELINFKKREFYLKNILEKVSSLYDYVLIDCPPSLGLLTINALVSAHKLMIPLQCEYYALEGLGQLINTYNLVKERLNNELELFGVIMTMADFRTNLTDQVIQEVKEYFQKKVFNTIIPRSIKLSEAPGFGKPAIIYAPNSRGAFHYRLITEEFLERLNVPYNYLVDESDKIKKIATTKIDEVVIQKVEDQQ